MSQIVTWYGVGDGTQDDPIVLINDSSFDGTKPFNIVIETTTLIPENEMTYIKFSTFQTLKLFTLALFYIDKGPLVSLTASYASKKTVFNGANNNKITSGSYVTLTQNNIDFIIPTQVYQTQIYTELAINKRIYKYLDDLIVATEELMPESEDTNLIKKIIVPISGGQISLYVSQKEIQELINASVEEEAAAREVAIIAVTNQVNESIQQVEENITQLREDVDEDLLSFETRVGEVESKNQEMKDDLDGHILSKTNPHEVTKEQVGLSNVENISPSDMPVSTPQNDFIEQIRIALLSSINSHANSGSNPHNVTKAQVGLSNVENISPSDMPVSSQQQSAIDLVLSIINAHMLNEDNPHNVRKDQISGLDKVENKTVAEIFSSTEANAAFIEKLANSGFILETDAELNYRKKLVGAKNVRPEDDVEVGEQYFNETDKQFQVHVGDNEWLYQKYGHDESLPSPNDGASHTYNVIGNGVATSGSLGTISVGGKMVVDSVLVVSNVNGVLYLADLTGTINGMVSDLEIISTGFLNLIRVA